jgi:ABC-type phosphate transport system substrate-binding protein
VIVNGANSLSSLDDKEVSKLFLKKSVLWPNGQPALPVDQSERSSVREIFSKEVHGKTTSSLQAYWQQQIFSGRNIPPPEKGSDGEVIAFVKANPNAIGYVSAQPSEGGIKVLKINH